MLRMHAYAKINLALNIVGTRADGYHLLDMIMQSIQLHDTLEMESLPAEQGIRLLCDGFPAGEENLAYRAAARLREALDIKEGVGISLRKRIPVQAGLGGGSADAAAVLRGCCALWGCSPSQGMLGDLALRLGADVPFCFLVGTARVRGVGERVEPVTLPFAGGVVVLHPGTGISTPEAYRRYDALGGGLAADIEAMLQPGSHWQQYMGNALQPAGKALCPAVTAMLADLRQESPLAAMMTGSGSAVFALCQDDAHAEALAAAMHARWPVALATRFAEAGCRIVSR